MGTLTRPLPLFSTTSSFTKFSIFPTFFISKLITPSNPKFQLKVSSKLESFLHMTPEPKAEFLEVEVDCHDTSSRLKYDVIIIGAGPAGLRLAERVSLYGVKVCCIDPSPLSMWPNNYGVWVDEFEAMGLEDCLDKTWPMTKIHIDDRNTKYLDRQYGRVSRERLKTKLMEGCVSYGVKFHKAKVWRVDHQEFESFVTCDDGSEIKGNLIVDASGFASTFTQFDKPRNPGYQIAHGILAEVEEHPFDLDKMVLMDWRDSHMGNEPYLRKNNDKLPTFLYAMPFDSNLVFLEETSLVSRPALLYMEVKKRMVARLRHLGIKVKRIIEEEKCLIPMGGPLPMIPQSVTAIGGTGGLVHPSTGYVVARALALAPILTDTIVECLGSNRMIRGRQLHRKVWSKLWPMESRSTREYYRFGMETLLKLDLKGTRSFFDAFFDLDPYYWQGFLSSRLSLGELALLSLSLFGKASNLSRFDIVTKCPLPLAKMVGNLALETI
ncbi:hypothetical protein GIB67_012738 [Kingdonia uniflora]|uniref:Lycopene beta-cyclase n=1 Tax=Kingdonia uniflora TaxID=39325 RepID=A0A7J7NF46_9MAGN|nr:hypothetical protein GIB67_012738 [Kingdonia uniflora]